jgi:enoyl-CoA hydratase/carnithine racemase
MGASAGEVEIIRDGPVMHIRLNRAHKLNAVTRAMYDAITEALGVAEVDDGITVVVISGAGDAFCAGNDLADFLAYPPASTDAPAFRFLYAISSATKVLVAAVHGAVVGVGATMLLHCDFVVAARNTSLSVPFVELGLVPEAASTLLLPRAVGHARAAELLLLGNPIDAETAAQWGLVNRVVDAAELMAAAGAIASRIASLPAASVRLTKALLKGDQSAVARRIEQEGAVFLDRLRGDDFQQKAATFLANRADRRAPPSG